MHRVSERTAMMSSHLVGSRPTVSNGGRAAGTMHRLPGLAALSGNSAIRAPATGGRARRRVTSMSMANEQVGAAYAVALVELAQSNDTLEAVHADVDALMSVLKEDEALREFLTNPVMGDDKKKELLASIAKEGGFDDSTKTFLFLTVDKGRIDCLFEICEFFETEYCKLTDTKVATLRSAVKLEKEQQFLIAKKLQELTGSKNIKLKPVVDKSLIAGFTVEYGSSQIDMSIKGQLDKIGAELEAAAGR